jgi:hypothetical protein
MEMLVKWEGAGATLTTGIDSAAGLVRLAPGGNWTVDDVSLFYTMQKRINDTARVRYGVLKIVMDLRSSYVVTAEVSAAMSAISARLYGPADCIAAITTSALLKLQLRRAFNAGIIEVFTDLSEAEAWLTSLSSSAPTAAHNGAMPATAALS